MKQKITKPKNESGFAMMISVIFFVVISAIALLGIMGPTARDYRTANDAVLSRQSYFLAESSSEDVYYRLKHSDPVSSTETLVLGSSYTTTTMNNLGSGNVDISSIGNSSNRERAVDVKISGQNGFILSYGVQTGVGGLDLGANGSDGATVTGDVFSNGPITGVYNSTITGSAISVNSASLFVDQSNSTGTPAYDTVFGTASITKDMFQSFQIDQSIPLDRISLYIKKIGTPADATVYIYGNDDSTNKPDWNVIASATLSGSSVGASYSWVDVVFSQKQMLSVGRTYWFAVSPTLDSSNYYTIGTTNVSPDRYTNGVAKYGSIGGTYWSDPISGGADYFFKISLGGVTGLIAGNTNGNGNMNIGTDSTNSAHANSVNSATVSGDIYCASGGSNNKSCLTFDNPSPITNPISDSDILKWKSDAVSGTASSGTWNINYSGATSWGPKKQNGNVNVTTGTLLLRGTLWVTGNLNVNGGNIKLDSTYGSNNGVIVVDGKVSINGGYVQGTTNPLSHILIVSTNDSIDTTSPAILATTNGTEPALFYAPYGLVEIVDTTPSQATGYEVNLSGDSNISYDSSISSFKVLSTSSTSTSYNISSWSESQ